MYPDIPPNLPGQTHFMREAGITLVVSSLVLGLFFFVPLSTPWTRSDAEAPVAAATSTSSAFENTQIEAKAAIVYDLATGETLYAKNADAQLPLASLTKLHPVYAAVSELPLETKVTIPNDVAALEAPRAFSAGQIFTLADLARLTLTASLNDGAVAIAEATAGGTNRSAQEALASAATALHLSQTYAVNGSGLDVNTVVSGGYGSPRDLARLAGALVEKAPSIASATTLPSARAVSVGGTAITVSNTDPVVAAIPHILLSKTGFTDLASGNLALVFDVGIGHPISVVVLGSSKKARFTDGVALVAATLAHFAGVPSL